MSNKIEKQIYFGSKDELEQVKLNSVSEIVTDGIHSTPKYCNGTIIPFVNGNNISDRKIILDEKTKYIDSDEFKKYTQYHNQNSIIISLNGTIGNVGIRGIGDFLFGKSIGYINTNSQIINLFLMHQLSADVIQKKLISELTGSTIKNLSLSSIKNLEILLPPVHIQENIASMLSSIDNLITSEKNKVNSLNGANLKLLNYLYSDYLKYTKGEIALSTIFKKDVNTIYINDEMFYSQITISNSGIIKHRGIKQGYEIGRKRQYMLILKENIDYLIFIRQGIFNGGIGFVENNDLDKSIVTENMPILMLDNEQINKHYFKYYLKSIDYRKDIIYPLKPTGSAQTAIHEKEFLNQIGKFHKIVDQLKIANILSQMDNFTYSSLYNCILLFLFKT